MSAHTYGVRVVPSGESICLGTCTCAMHCANRCEKACCCGWCTCWCHAAAYLVMSERRVCYTQALDILTSLGAECAA